MPDNILNTFFESIGCNNSIYYHKAICDAACTMVVKVNESQPWVYSGYDEAIHISQVNYAVENKQL